MTSIWWWSEPLLGLQSLTQMCLWFLTGERKHTKDETLCCPNQDESWDIVLAKVGTPEVEADIVHMQTQTLGVRTCKWATYAASPSKLGQHLGRHTEFNCPLSCGLYTSRARLKRSGIMAQSSELFRTDPAFSVSLCHKHPPRKSSLSPTQTVGHFELRITVLPWTKAGEGGHLPTQSQFNGL